MNDKTYCLFRRWAGAVAAALTVLNALADDAPPKAPRFSIEYMDKTVDPGADFYEYACGTWVKENPVPADKSRWGGFGQLQERNWYLIHQLLDSAAQPANGPVSEDPKRAAVIQKVGDFYKSAMDTNHLEKLGFKPIRADLKRVDRVKSKTEFVKLLADLQLHGVGACFEAGVSPDAKNSDFYAFELDQGGLGLPDRDYYLSDGFAKQRAAYEVHVAKMFALSGEKQDAAKAHAKTVLDVETELAKASKSRVDLRDPVANYHKLTTASLLTDYPDLDFGQYLAVAGMKATNLVVGQPEFFAAVDKMIKDRPLDDWKVYLRWHVIREAAPYLHAAAEDESFAFYGTELRGQLAQEPRWQRSAKVIDSHIGEALGQLFVEKYFPPTAKARMKELVENLKAVFRDRLKNVDWMSDETRTKALAKFDLFTQKIGYPDKFRDYSKVAIRADDFLGNVRRAELFEVRRQLARIGQHVDKTEWRMTPSTVNAYFNPLQNEIVFPAGILQPPFFDVELDDAVNYGAIGVVIGHEITHGYDDEGRKFDAHGNLNDWWTSADAKAFEERAQKVVDQYNAYEPLPGVHVNGKLTLGENLADLGGTSIAFEAMQRALAKNPSRRKTIDGLTPEQRFFISLSQVWRTNIRDAEAKRLVTVDPHSPGRFRAIGPHVNQQAFYEAFGIKEGAPMWRAPELRAKVW
ncbi:MAG TPA: M13 family metallopeptidase [Verrucomicrobiae bacterium]|nr:M13 family metallopeptidase [Verrucomicrobiae bacterium]